MTERRMPAGVDAASSVDRVVRGGRGRGAAAGVLRLQASAGNRAVRSLLRQATGLDGLDVAARQKLQEATAPIGDDVIEEEGFGEDITPLPAGTDLVFGATVPTDAKFRKGLASAAAEMLAKTYQADSADAAKTNFRENTTVKIRYDFSKFKGADGIWQFTYVALSKPGTHRLLIDYLGKEPAYPVPSGGTDQLTKKGFAINGFSAGEKDDVLMAFGLLPEKAIAKLPKGLKFARATDPSAVKDGCGSPAWAGGDYCDKNKTVTMYDKWVESSRVRFARSDNMTRAVVHEIGHAIDLTHQSDHDAFAEALTKDGGVAVTGYGAANTLESYAECFSLFIVDPNQLKALRANVHDYFVTTFG